MSHRNLPVLLAILDGYGLAEEGEANAISRARTPILDRLFAQMPHTRLKASGNAVGLPEGQMGNSEVGHLNLGAGRIVDQELTRIDKAIADGSFSRNVVINGAIDAALVSGRSVHVMGLVSDGGVHSSLDHAEAIIKLAARKGIADIHVHAFMDGRDVSPTSGVRYLERLSAYCARVSEQTSSHARISSVMGRYYAMDRDNRWDRVEAAWDAIVEGEGTAETNPMKALEASYERGVTDEFIEPIVLDNPGIVDGDTVIFFNFRPDRARELTSAFIAPRFSGFELERPSVSFVTLTDYDPDLPAAVAFEKLYPQSVLADVLASEGLSQLHAAETEKYAHVTFFFNGGLEDEKIGESRLLIPSPKVATYDLQPSMSAVELTDELVDAIEKDAADIYIVNYANCDMVGHTGVMDAAIEAVETVDMQLGRLLDAVEERGGSALITADHGNVDHMFDIAEDGEHLPVTAHTLNDVPLIMVGVEGAVLDEAGGKLADVAPTLLGIIGVDPPKSWTGRSLLVDMDQGSL